MQLNDLDIIVIITYLAAMSLIGLYFSKRQNTRDDLFLGGCGIHCIIPASFIIGFVVSIIAGLLFSGKKLS